MDPMTPPPSPRQAAPRRPQRTPRDPGAGRPYRTVGVLLLLTALVGLGTVASGTEGPALQDREGATPPAPFLEQPGFVGAETCGRCHEEQYQAWRGSTHGRAGGPPSAETVIAPFDGTPIRFADATVTPRSEGGAYRFIVEQADREPVVYTVDGVIGRGHMVGGGTQGFVSMFPDGTVRFLPFDWSRTEGRWFCNTARIAGWWAPGGERSRPRPDRGWIPVTEELRIADCGDWPPVRVLGTDLRFANCQGCHASQVTVTAAPATGGFQTRMTSLAINCESCHGPGAAHVDLARAGGLPGADDPRIGQLSTLGEDASIDVCLTCHALKRALQTGYVPGDAFENHYSLLLPLVSDDPFFPDGRVRTFGYQLNHKASGCYLDGSMTCVDCHAPHGQGYRTPSGRALEGRFSDGQCLECHASKAADPAGHTGHPQGSEGSRCVSCHMPYLQQPDLGDRIRYARSDHTIPVPRPAADRALGVPDACGKCHGDRTPEDLERWTRERWGDLKPRRSEVRALVARVTAHGEERSAAGPPEALLDPTNRNAMAQVAALDHLVDLHLSPDMAALDGGIEAGLRALTEHPDRDVQAVALAVLHMSRGADPEVRAFLTSTLESLGVRQEPVLRRWVAALRFMADGYRQSGEPVDALSVFSRVLEINPTDAATLLDMGSLFQALGDSDTALDYYRRSLEADPEQSVTWVNLGLALESLDRRDEAAAAYESAIAVYRWDALAHMNLGNLYLTSGDPDRALELYRSAVAADPSLAQAHYLMGVAHLQDGEREAAARALRRALEFAPGHEDARELLDRLILETPELGERTQHQDPP